MKELSDAEKTVDRNKIAVLWSLIPGLGHIYKHHFLAGLGILIAGNVLVVFSAATLTLTTLGFSLIFVPAVWGAYVAYSAYMASDRHGPHHGRRISWGGHAAT